MLKGTHMTLESRQRLCASHKGKKPFLGHKHSEETKLRYSLMRKGKPRNPPMTDEIRHKVSEGKIGKRQPGRVRQCPNAEKLVELYKYRGIDKVARIFHTNTRTVRRWLTKLGIPIIQLGTSECNQKRMRAMRIHPSQPEKQFSELLLCNNLPFKYVGDGEFVLGGKCPDFLNVNGKKQLIEILGTYWHPIFDVAKRTEHFRSYGFDTLCIWEDELKEPEKVIKKVKAFIRRR